MKRTRLFVPVVLLLLIFFATNLVQASPNWLPLPPVAGGDPGEEQNSWFPVLQASCDTVSIDMTAPDFFFINSAGFQAVEWRFNELRIYNPATQSESVVATTPDASYGIDPRSIGVFTAGGLQTATFSIDTPLAAGSRVYGTFQFRRQPMGDPQNPPPYEDWNAEVFNVGDFSWRADHFLRVYDPDYSVSHFGEAVELSCDPAYDLNTVANAPTISLDANGNPSSVLEGNSGVQQFTYNLVLSAPSSRTITAHVSVGGQGGNTENRPSGGWTDWEDANQEGVDHNMVNVANSLDYRVAYPFDCGTGTSYCDLGIDAQPSFIHEIVFAPGEVVKPFTVEVYGDTVVEHDQPITIHINDVSYAIISKGGFGFNDLSLTILDDDEPTITPSSAPVTMNECGVANGVQSAPFNLDLVMSHAIDFDIGLYHFTYPATATDNEDYVKIATEPMSPPFLNLTIPAGETTVTIPVRIIGDNVAEDAETFTLELMNGIVEYEVVTPSRTEPTGFDSLPGKLATNAITFTIAANGPAATLSNGNVTEGDSGQINMTFTVTLAALAKDQTGSNRDVTISYQTADGSAVAGQDYVTTSGQVTIPAGQLSATINVPIIGDLQPEASEESFSLQLTGSDGACLPQAASTGLITDNDYLQNLTVNGDTTVAPLDLTFGWDQPEGIDPATAWYHLVINRDSSVVYNKWHNGAGICSGSTCGVNIVDTAPYEFANGGYTWDVSASVGGTTFSSEGASAFTVNIGNVPQPVVTGVAGNAGIPTVQWNEDTPTEWYQIYVTPAGSSTILFKKWVHKSDVCNGGACSLDISTLLGQGDYQAYVKGYGPQSQFSGTPVANLPLSDPYAFNIDLNMAVSGDVSLGQPTFSWNANGEATWYHLHVRTAGGTAKLDKWYKAADLGCSDGGTCTVAPAINLISSDYGWWIQSWGPANWNNNSSAFRSHGPNFSVTTAPPAQITGLDEQNENGGRPTFSWAHDANATYYQFVVKSNVTGVVLLNKWYKQADLACTDDNTCSPPPALNLKLGGHQWWVRAWGPGGFNNGDSTLWSNRAFTVNPVASAPPTGMSPAGTSPTSPTFSWAAPDDISWYHLWVETADGGTVVHKKWYAADMLGCTTNGSTCSVTPLAELAAGTYRWRVRTYNPTGISVWSDWVQFAVG